MCAMMQKLRMIAGSVWPGLGAFVVALAISLVWPATSYWPLFLLALNDPVVGAWRRARGSGSATTRVGG